MDYETLNKTTTETNFVNSCDHLVIYSGGIDSTVMLYDLLRKYSTHENPVGILTFEPFFVGDTKNVMETKARKRFISYLEREKYNFVHNTVRLEAWTNARGNHYTQLYSWLTNAMPIASHDATIHIGVLLDDSQTEYIYKIKEIHEMSNKVLGKDTKLSFSIMGRTKAESLEYAIRKDLLKYTWSCQMPDGNKPCKTCGSCSAITEGLIKLCYYDPERKDTYEALLKVYDNKPEDDTCRIHQHDSILRKSPGV